MGLPKAMDYLESKKCSFLFEIHILMVTLEGRVRALYEEQPDPSLYRI